MSVNWSLLQQLDELAHQVRILAEPCELEFLEFARNQEKCRLEWHHAEEQCERLQVMVDDYKAKLQDSEKKLCVARKLLEEEQLKRKAVKLENAQLEKQLELVRDVVFQGKGKLNDETKEKLAFLNNTSVRSRRSFGHCDPQRLNTITEVMDSTGSILSDLGYTQSEDELDASLLLCSSRPWKKFSTPSAEEAPSVKRVRRSNKNHETAAELTASAGDRLVATTTVTMECDGPIIAHSKIETNCDKDSNDEPAIRKNSCHFPETVSQRTSPLASTSVLNYGQGISNKFYNRPHIFTNRTMLTPDMCGVCGNKIKFAKVVVRCKECRITCHMECKNQAPLPCIPAGNTPTKKGFLGTIGDFTPAKPPMVPAIVVHCLQEVEQRGLNEVGIYRVSGSDREVKALKEKFLRGKGVPNIGNVDIHVVCSTVKDFLRSLKEPLVSHALWQDFVHAAEIADPEDSRAAMYQAISSLPQANRDTLAFLMLHLQRVGEWPDCKMPVENLAKVFGPTVVGYSSPDVEGITLVRETKKQVAVMQQLMSLPAEYWMRFTQVDPDAAPLYGDLHRTPSMPAYSSSSICPSYFGATPASAMSAGSRRERLFDTPPMSK